MQCIRLKELHVCTEQLIYIYIQQHYLLWHVLKRSVNSILLWTAKFVEIQYQFFQVIKFGISMVAEGLEWMDMNPPYL